MPSPIRTTNDIIIGALRLIGELGASETPTADMIENGLELLNELLGKFTTSGMYIPYSKQLTFKMVPGKKDYTIGDVIPGASINSQRIVELEYVNFLLETPSPTNNDISANFTVNFTNNRLLVNNAEDFPLGSQVTVSSTGTLPAPLLPGETYYTIPLGTVWIYLARNYSDAVNGYFIDLLNEGTGIHLVTRTFANASNEGANNISYPVGIIDKSQYYDYSRVTGTASLPAAVFLNQLATESVLTFYPLPDRSYTVSVQAKVMPTYFQAQESLIDYPPNYYGFLKYALARKFLSIYPSANWQQTAEEEYQDYYAALKNANQRDMELSGTNAMQPDGGDYYAWQQILSL